MNEMNCILYMMNWTVYELNLNKAVKKKKKKYYITYKGRNFKV